MVVTRQEKQQQQLEHLSYVIEEVLEKGKNSNIAKALHTHGYNSVPALMMADRSEINGLDFVNYKGNIVELLTSERNLLQVFQQYYQKYVTRGQSFRSMEDYQQLNCDDFDDFCITCQLPSIMPTILTSSSSINPSKPSTYSAVRDFHKGTKKDMNMFPTLKHPEKWDSFEREI